MFPSPRRGPLRRSSPRRRPFRGQHAHLTPPGAMRRVPVCRDVVRALTAPLHTHLPVRTRRISKMADAHPQRPDVSLHPHLPPPCTTTHTSTPSRTLVSVTQLGTAALCSTLRPHCGAVLVPYLDALSRPRIIGVEGSHFRGMLQALFLGHVRNPARQYRFARIPMYPFTLPPALNIESRRRNFFLTAKNTNFKRTSTITDHV